MRIQQQSPFATDKSRCLASAFWLALLPAQYWCLSIRHAASSPLLLSMAPLHSLNANVYVVKSASGREPIQALRAVPCRAVASGAGQSLPSCAVHPTLPSVDVTIAKVDLPA